MVTESRPLLDGAMLATRIDPPVFTFAVAPPTPTSVAPPPLFDVGVLLPPQAAIIAVVMPRVRPSRTNSRRLTRPAAKASIRSSCKGDAARRARSKLR